jgi:UTP:GlnB (protein PII) uridylyltransferase
MGTLSLPKITPATVRGGDFIDSVPEIYELSSVIENNESHDHDDVFSHTVRVLSEIGNLLSTYEGGFAAEMGRKVVTHTRKELLMLAALLHDVAKKETLVVGPDKKTSAAGHEKAGMQKAAEILGRFDIPSSECELVLEIIGFHGELHELAKKGSALTKSEADAFKRKHARVLPELLILVMADTMGSQLSEKDPFAFDRKMNFLRSMF